MGGEAELLGQKARLFELCWSSWLLFHEPQAAQQTAVCSLLKAFAFPISQSPVMIPGEKGPAVSVARSSFFDGDMKEKGIVFFVLFFLSGVEPFASPFVFSTQNF